MSSYRLGDPENAPLPGGVPLHGANRPPSPPLAANARQSVRPSRPLEHGAPTLRFYGTLSKRGEQPSGRRAIPPARGPAGRGGGHRQRAGPVVRPAPAGSRNQPRETPGIPPARQPALPPHTGLHRPPPRPGVERMRTKGPPATRPNREPRRTNRRPPGHPEDQRSAGPSLLLARHVSRRRPARTRLPELPRAQGAATSPSRRHALNTNQQPVGGSDRRPGGAPTTIQKRPHHAPGYAG
ncbi:proline-rich protein HaeIII subfamily 1-like [Osmia bicornis bicornis]|uniref:proline-rich protein HaeIII subfamily 1-like n=1 Tax=Osmia bicornis bicornis TaxID=1437191 RepID=UPI001EAF8B5E|nr:proline-rich protein HaeIII subfamily 1-like [Osmia bicornis bicornis]